MNLSSQLPWVAGHYGCLHFLDGKLRQTESTVQGLCCSVETSQTLTDRDWEENLPTAGLFLELQLGSSFNLSLNLFYIALEGLI